jgi:hypothetical protein
VQPSSFSLSYHFGIYLIYEPLAIDSDDKAEIYTKIISNLVKELRIIADVITTIH